MANIDAMTSAARTTRRAIRLWEKHGLLGVVGRDDQGRRVFTAGHIARAREVSALQMAGCSIAEIKEMHPATAYCHVAATVDFLRAVHSEMNGDFDL